MSVRMLLQTALLLVFGQGVLGLVGYYANQWPPVGVPLAFALVWLILRTALVLRDEAIKAKRKHPQVVPLAVAAFVATVWQVPSLVALPLWAPTSALEFWQGAMLPVLGAIDLFVPGLGTAGVPWLWVNMVWQAGLFLWVAIRPETELMLSISPAGERSADGEWAPARRFEEAFLRHKEQPENNEEKAGA